MVKKSYELKNRIILLTGATGHLGKTMAHQILSSGAKLIITSRSENNLKIFLSKIKKTYKKNCYAVCVDFTQDNQVNNLINKIKKKYKYINGLVNNAYSGNIGEIQLIGKKDFMNSTSLNLYTPFKLIQNLKPLLAKGYKVSKVSSSVINISSMYGMISPNPQYYKNKNFFNPINYGVTKAGLIQLTKYLACHLGKDNIRVNSISPGPFPQSTKGLKVKNIKSYKIPLNRFGKPIEVAEPVVFLLSNKSSYINGSNLVVDGGWTAW